MEVEGGIGGGAAQPAESSLGSESASAGVPSQSEQTEDRLGSAGGGLGKNYSGEQGEGLSGSAAKTQTGGSDPPSIDWTAALEQCGGDKEFLVELLDDFYSEITAQLQLLKTILEADTPDYHRLKVICHGVKGAAANLMCPLIREKALQLEKFSASLNGKSVTKEEADLVKAYFAQLMDAMKMVRQCGVNVDLGL